MILVPKMVLPRSSVVSVSSTLFVLIMLSFQSFIVKASWTLIHHEDFTEPLDEGGVEWELETYAKPFDTIMDDNGDWYRNDYGDEDFDPALRSFDTYRKEFQIGKDGWLTASLSLRDSNENGVFDEVQPELFIEDFGDSGNVLTMNIKEHTGGALLRPTKALPEAYRIEYKLKFLDFGGKKEGSINYKDGRINGYSPEGCKTQHPWGEGSGSKGWTGDASVPYCEWQSVREGPYGYNGFAFLSIVDFADPAPRNNHFWHYRRKLLMDSFSVHPDRVGDGSGGQVCDASTNQYYDYKDSESWTTVNMWISGLPGSWSPNPGGLAGNSQKFITNCNGQKATGGLQSAGELQPEFLPDKFYTFAVERNATGYTMEASGYFARAGFQTFRFFRPFVVDNEPIWHYNVKANEYDGRYNNDLKQENWAHGSQTWPDQWPAGSAYPDYFVIGDYYTNVYEGRASLTDIRYYEPDSPDQQCTPDILLASNVELVESNVIQKGDVFLLLEADGNLQVWRGLNGNKESLLWESGVTGPIQHNYVTKLQGDGNLLVSKKASNGSKSTLWKSSSMNPHGKFYLVHECEVKGDGVAIYRGLPGEGGYPVWTKDAINHTPTTVAPVPSPVDDMCQPATFLQKGGTITKGRTIERGGAFMAQKENGNLEVRLNTPENPGPLVWESGVNDSADKDYYTILQGDGNLITWKVEADGTESLAWKSGTSNPGGQYFFLLECNGNNANVAIYRGGTLIWAAGSISVPAPTASPVAPGACSPGRFLDRDHSLPNGKTIGRGGAFLTQMHNGNLEVRLNTPTHDGPLVWESGVNDSTDTSYYTVLQGDGNMITWKVKADGSKSPVWKSNTSIQNGQYFFVLKCNGNNADVAIYQGLPEDGGTLIWYPAPRACSPVVFLERDQNVPMGTTIAKPGAYLTQKDNGNIEVRLNTPDDPGSLVWESGVNDSTDKNYYTVLQGDGNLITWKVQADGSKSPVWTSGASTSGGPYFFVLECNGDAGSVAVYRGYPESGNAVWLQNGMMSSRVRKLRGGLEANDPSHPPVQ